MSAVVKQDHEAKEAISMLTRGIDDDIVFGRMPVGQDESEFEALPPLEIDMTPEQNRMLHDDDPNPWQQPVELAGSPDAVPAMFEPPASDETEFPLLRQALRQFRPTAKTVRIDSDHSYDDFVCERAVREISRRLSELRHTFEQHVADHHGGNLPAMSAWSQEVMGAVQAVADLRAAPSSKAALDAMPQVPVDLPAFAEGKVRCWREGDAVYCSIRFCTVDGSPRVATMASRPRADADEVARWAMKSGVEPATVLGLLPDITIGVAAQKLVREVAGAALAAHRRADVVGVNIAPIHLTEEKVSTSVPLAALMQVEQMAGDGNLQAQREMAKLRRIAQTPIGEEIIAPLLAQSTKVLGDGRRRKIEAKQGFFKRLMGKYAAAAGWA